MSLKGEKLLFSSPSGGKSPQSILGKNPVTGTQQGKGICRHDAAHRPGGFGMSRLLRQLGIGYKGSPFDAFKLPHDPDGKSRPRRIRQRKTEAFAPTVKVFPDLLPTGFKESPGFGGWGGVSSEIFFVQGLNVAG